ncbi:MAG: PUR family DNA/RNA-binding protein [Bacteroidales bacterium]|nr:PUR family DNA/RNA-binding protein [Bacteroidales bacterium]
MENDKSNERREIFSQAIRAGKRTYFFDVKETRAGEYYLTITESKRRFNKEQEKFYFEKHKLFLYKEDFEKFSNGLKSAVDFIESAQAPDEQKPEETNGPKEEPKSDEDLSLKRHTNVDFDDLGTNENQDEKNDSEEDNKNE